MQEYRQYFHNVSCGKPTTNCLYIMDIPLGVRKNINYCVKSYEIYAKTYNLDLILLKEINPKYRIFSFQQHTNNTYYGIIIPQLFNILQLFQDYQNVMYVSQNDILITPNSFDYFSLHTTNLSDISFFYGTHYSNILDVLKPLYTPHVSDQQNLVYQCLKGYKYGLLIRQILGVQQNCQNIFINVFNNIFSRRGKQVFNFDRFKQFLVNVYKYGNTPMWDGYVGSVCYQAAASKKYNSGFLNEVIYTGQPSPLLQIHNHLGFTDQQVLRMVRDASPQIIHFPGGGQSTGIATIRNRRSKLIFDYFYKGRM